MTRDTIIEEIRRILSVLDERRRLGRPSYLTSVRKSVESSITLRLSEYVSFLDQQGLVDFDRRRNTLELRPSGDELLGGGAPPAVLAAIDDQFSSVLDEPAPSAPPAAPPQREQRQPDPPPEPERRAVTPDPEPPPPEPEPRRAAPRTPPSERRSRTPPVTPPGRSASAPAPAPRPSTPSSRGGGDVSPHGASTAERYQREESLGTGGIGQVFRARHLVLERVVVIKEIKSIFNYFPSSRRHEILDQIQEVVSVNACLNHPFVLNVLDLDLSAEFPFIVSEFCPGGSLRGRIQDGGRLEPRESLQLFVQVAEGLAYAHRQGVLHRSLKPENILLDAFGNAKLADFGMSRVAEREAQKGQFYMGMGTVAYMSPEQFQDVDNITEQSDLYSLGIILYEMLTGKLPGRRSPMPSEYFSDIPADLDDIFDRMTMDFLEERYTSVDEVLLDIYRSPAILGLLQRRGPNLFTDTDLSSLPDIPEPRSAAQRESPRAVSRSGRRASVPPPSSAPPLDQGAGGHEPAGEPAGGRRASRISRRLDRMADDLFSD